MSICAIIVAAGKGERLPGAVPKQFMELAGRPVLAHTVDKFERCPEVDEIVIVTGLAYVDYCRDNIVTGFGFKKVVNVLAGGSERQQSVYRALESVSAEYVLVHDGVRPFVSEACILAVIGEVKKNKSCVLGVPVKDTIKVCDGERNIVCTPARDGLWAVQTPQGFRRETLLAAHEDAIRHGVSVTDDGMLVERMGETVSVVPGSYDNIKITTEDDLIFAEFLLREKLMWKGTTHGCSEKNG